MCFRLTFDDGAKVNIPILLCNKIRKYFIELCVKNCRGAIICAPTFCYRVDILLFVEETPNGALRRFFELFGHNFDFLNLLVGAYKLVQSLAVAFHSLG